MTPARWTDLVFVRDDVDAVEEAAIQARAREAELAEELNPSPVAAKNDYADALAPMGLDTGFSAPLRRWAQMEVRRQTGYLPYL